MRNGVRTPNTHNQHRLTHHTTTSGRKSIQYSISCLKGQISCVIKRALQSRNASSLTKSSRGSLTQIKIIYEGEFFPSAVCHQKKKKAAGEQLQDLFLTAKIRLGELYCHLAIHCHPSVNWVTSPLLLFVTKAISRCYYQYFP